jgi:hypothetical protein
MSDFNIFSDGLTFLAFVYICLALLGLIVLIVAARTLHRLFTLPAERGGNTLQTVTKAALIGAFILIGHFWLVGGANKGGALVIGGNSYIEAQASAIFFILGIIVARIIQPRHRKTA